MGKTHLRYFESNVCYVCVECHTEITLPVYIESKSFHGSTGTAYLFNKIINYKLGKSEQKVLSTGMHTIQDVHCLQCDSLIGWHYVAAENHSNNYKIGKSCIERALIKRVNYDDHEITEDRPIAELPTPLWVQAQQNSSSYSQPVFVPPSSLTNPVNQEDEIDEEEIIIEEQLNEEQIQGDQDYEYYIQQEEPGEEENLISESQTEEQVYTD